MTEEFDNPWGWFVDHKQTHENVNNSGYDIGVDADGDPIIHFRGHARTINPCKLLEAMPEDRRETLLRRYEMGDDE